MIKMLQYYKVYKNCLVERQDLAGSKALCPTLVTGGREGMYPQ